MLEADLAYKGIDLRDVWTPGSGLTLRRLYRLIVALPPEARIWARVEAEQQAAMKPTPEQIRDRQAHYAAQGNA